MQPSHQAAARGRPIADLSLLALPDPPTLATLSRLASGLPCGHVRAIGGDPGLHVTLLDVYHFPGHSRLAELIQVGRRLAPSLDLALTSAPVFRFVGRELHADSRSARLAVEPCAVTRKLVRRLVSTVRGVTEHPHLVRRTFSCTLCRGDHSKHPVPANVRADLCFDRIAFLVASREPYGEIRWQEVFQLAEQSRGID